MIKSFFKILLWTFFLFFFYFFQMSFLPFFSIVQLNFSALLVLIINIFEDPKSNIGIYCAFLIGFLSDIFSPYFFGSITLLLVSLSILIKFFLLRYVRIS